MSHIQKLTEAKKECEANHECSSYQALLQYEHQQIDARTADHISSAIILGSIIFIVGLLVLLTPFLKQVRRFQKFIIPKLAIIIPLLFSVAAGFLIGLMISFGSCFKQQCSAAEEYALFIAPAFALVLSLPISLFIYKRQLTLTRWVENSRGYVWITVGILIMLFGVLNTVDRIDDVKNSGEKQKVYLSNL